MTATCVLLLAGIAARGIRGERPPAPEDLESDPGALSEPMQFLARGAALRMRELSPRISEQHAEEWADTWRLVFGIESCPRLLAWIDGPDGQRCERLLGDLRRGSRDEALASLALLVELSRSTRWSPGLRTGSQHAERLGGLLQDWLRVWAPRSADDPQLLEPALGAVLLYGRVLRKAYDAPTFGFADAPYDRARSFLDDLTGARAPERTPFGARLAERYPRAFETLAARKDFLLGSSEEARRLFPDIDGSCAP